MNRSKYRKAVLFLWIEILFVYALPDSGFGQYSDPNEPNDSFSQATAFTLPATFKADFDPVGDADFYKFNGQQGDTLDIQISRRSDSDWIGMRIQLYDSDQQTVVRDVRDDYSALIQFVLQHAGDYYIKAFASAGAGDSKFDYVLRIKGTVHLVLPSLTLISPNGSEEWQGLSQHNITWETREGVDKIHHIKLLLSTDSGNSFPQTITENTADDGVFEWTVPRINSNSVRIKVQALDAGNLVLVQDISDADFSITSPTASITLTSPNGGEVWQGGATKNITWTASGDIDHIRILYSTDSGASYPNVVVESTSNTALYAWNVPTINCSAVRIKVQAMDNGNSILAEDASDADFSISTETEGFQLMWTFNASALIQWLDHWEDGFVAGDLNDDGTSDVVFGTKAGDVVAVNGANGTNFESCDLDNDGDTELIVSDWFRGTTVLIDGKTGDEIWSRSEAGISDVGDIDGDHFSEIVTGTWRAYEPDVPNHYIAALDADSNPLFKYDLDSEPSAVVVANIDDDAANEVLVAVDSTLMPLDIGIIFKVCRPQKVSLPSAYKLLQNYPNPFNPTTTIKYSLPKPGNASITIFNTLGQCVRNLVDANQSAGTYQLTWHGVDDQNMPVPAGIFICRMETGSVVEVIKLAHVK